MLCSYRSPSPLPLSSFLLSPLPSSFIPNPMSLSPTNLLSYDLLLSSSLFFLLFLSLSASLSFTWKHSLPYILCPPSLYSLSYIHQIAASLTHPYFLHQLIFFIKLSSNILRVLDDDDALAQSSSVTSSRRARALEARKSIIASTVDGSIKYRSWEFDPRSMRPSGVCAVKKYSCIMMMSVFYSM